MPMKDAPPGEVDGEAGLWVDVEQDESIDMEVLEDDGVEVRVGERDEGLLQLAQMERKGLNVVCMDDIEAGLSAGRGKAARFSRRIFCGGGGTRDWSKVVKKDRRSGVRDDSGRVRKERNELDDGAVYGNVMLSSSSNSRLLLTSLVSRWCVNLL